MQYDTQISDWSKLKALSERFGKKITLDEVRDYTTPRNDAG